MPVPSVIVLAGSKSDHEIVKKVTDVLDEYSISYGEFVASAHRNPDQLDRILKENSETKVFICIAGLSAALPGVVASKVDQPVIGVPVDSALGGLDALLSIVQMPKGVPVATVGINNGANAAHLAARIIGVKKKNAEPVSYAEVGVDREEEEQTVSEILSIIRRSHVTGELPQGHFAGGIRHGDEIISLATDGVGTKVLLAQEFENYKTVGIDCVAMNVNDLVTTGSIPIAFVDYIAVERQDKELIKDLVEGLVEGCVQSEIPLVGGETAVMTEVIKGIRIGFDIAGTALGIQKADRMVTGSLIQAGDIMVGIESSGVHSNGLTLARKLKLDPKTRKELLRPTRIYVKAIKKLLDSEIEITGMAHITGGGFTNLLRLGKWHYNLKRWEIPDLFVRMSEGIDDREMYRTFNMGIGYVVIIRPTELEKTLDILNQFYPSYEIGRVEEGDDVTISGMSIR